MDGKGWEIGIGFGPSVGPWVAFYYWGCSVACRAVGKHEHHYFRGRPATRPHHHPRGPWNRIHPTFTYLYYWVVDQWRGYPRVNNQSVVPGVDPCIVPKRTSLGRAMYRCESLVSNPHVLPMYLLRTSPQTMHLTRMTVTRGLHHIQPT